MHAHKLTTAAAIGLGALLFAACSSGSEGSAGAAETRKADQEAKAATTEARFCRGAKSLYTQFQTGGATAENGQELFDAARRLTAPVEISEDWKTTLDALEPLVNPAATPAVDMQTAQETGVFDRVGTYIAETCGLAGDS